MTFVNESNNFAKTFLFHFRPQYRCIHEEKQRKRLEKFAARRKELENLEEGAKAPPPIPSDDEGIAVTEDYDQLKIKMDFGPYSMCRKAGLPSFAKKFGLKPDH